MKTMYGDIPSKQISNYKKILHNKIHWLLIYKERDYAELDKYFYYLLKKISSLNKIFNYQPEIIDLLCILQTARDLSINSDFDFKEYRKLIFDAHSAVDRIKES